MWAYEPTLKRIGSLIELILIWLKMELADSIHFY